MSRPGLHPTRRMIELSPLMEAAVRVYDARELVENSNIRGSGAENWRAGIMSALNDALILLHESGIPVPANPTEDEKDKT